MIKKEKKAILTFDYELFLGSDSGNLFTTLINPTNLIIEQLKQNNGKAIFFVDAVFLLYIKKNNYNDFELVKEQLKDILINNSFLGLHIHSQWLDAISLEDYRWSFKSYEKYRFHSLSEVKRVQLFNDCLEILQCIIDEVGIENNIKQKKIIHFRAGGWCIQPFEVFKELFIRSGIKYDFSVKPYFKLEKLPYLYFNFEKVSSGNECWAFSTDPCIHEENGVFIEYPVSTIKISGFFLLLNRLKFISNKSFGDGKSMFQSMSEFQTSNNLFKKVEKFFSLVKVNMQFESFSSIYFKFLYSKIFKKKSIITIVGHPKLFSQQAIVNLNYLLLRVQTDIPE